MAQPIISLVDLSGKVDTSVSELNTGIDSLRTDMNSVSLKSRTDIPSTEISVPTTTSSAVVATSKDSYVIGGTHNVIVSSSDSEATDAWAVWDRDESVVRWESRFDAYDSQGNPTRPAAESIGGVAGESLVFDLGRPRFMSDITLFSKYDLMPKNMTLLGKVDGSSAWQTVESWNYDLPFASDIYQNSEVQLMVQAGNPVTVSLYTDLEMSTGELLLNSTSGSIIQFATSGVSFKTISLSPGARIQFLDVSNIVQMDYSNPSQDPRSVTLPVDVGLGTTLPRFKVMSVMTSVYSSYAIVFTKSHQQKVGIREVKLGLFSISSVEESLKSMSVNYSSSVESIIIPQDIELINVSRSAGSTSITYQIEAPNEGDSTFKRFKILYDISYPQTKVITVDSTGAQVTYTLAHTEAERDFDFTWDTDTGKWNEPVLSISPAKVPVMQAADFAYTSTHGYTGGTKSGFTFDLSASPQLQINSIFNALVTTGYVQDNTTYWSLPSGATFPVRFISGYGVRPKTTSGIQLFDRYGSSMALVRATSSTQALSTGQYSIMFGDSASGPWNSYDAVKSSGTTWGRGWEYALIMIGPGSIGKVDHVSQVELCTTQYNYSIIARNTFIMDTANVYPFGMFSLYAHPSYLYVNNYYNHTLMQKFGTSWPTSGSTPYLSAYNSAVVNGWTYQYPSGSQYNYSVYWHAFEIRGVSYADDQRWSSGYSPYNMFVRIEWTGSTSVPSMASLFYPNIKAYDSSNWGTFPDFNMYMTAYCVYSGRTATNPNTNVTGYEYYVSNYITSGSYGANLGAAGISFGPIGFNETLSNTRYNANYRDKGGRAGIFNAKGVTEGYNTSYSDATWLGCSRIRIYYKPGYCNLNTFTLAVQNINGEYISAVFDNLYYMACTGSPSGITISNSAFSIYNYGTDYYYTGSGYAASGYNWIEVGVDPSWISHATSDSYATKLVMKGIKVIYPNGPYSVIQLSILQGVRCICPVVGDVFYSWRSESITNPVWGALSSPTTWSESGTTAGTVKTSGGTSVEMISPPFTGDSPAFDPPVSLFSDPSTWGTTATWSQRPKENVNSVYISWEYPQIVMLTKLTLGIVQNRFGSAPASSCTVTLRYKVNPTDGGWLLVPSTTYTVVSNNIVIDNPWTTTPPDVPAKCYQIQITNNSPAWSGGSYSHIALSGIWPEGKVSATSVTQVFQSPPLLQSPPTENPDGSYYVNGPYVWASSGQADLYGSNLFIQDKHWTSMPIGDRIFDPSGHALPAEWVEIQYPQACVIDTYSFTATTASQIPVDWTLFGGDGTSWTALDVRTGNSSTTWSQPSTEKTVLGKVAVQKFTKFAFVVTRANGSGVSLSDLQLNAVVRDTQESQETVALNTVKNIFPQIVDGKAAIIEEDVIATSGETLNSSNIVALLVEAVKNIDTRLSLLQP